MTTTETDARTIAHDAYMADPTGLVTFSADPSGSDDYWLRVDGYGSICVGSGEVDDDGEMVYCWTAYDFAGEDEPEYALATEGGREPEARAAIATWIAEATR